MFLRLIERHQQDCCDEHHEEVPKESLDKFPFFRRSTTVSRTWGTEPNNVLLKTKKEIDPTTPNRPRLAMIAARLSANACSDWGRNCCTTEWTSNHCPFRIRERYIRPLRSAAGRAGIQIEQQIERQAHGEKETIVVEKIVDP